MYIGLHVKYPLFLSDFNKTWIFATDLEKSSNIIFLLRISPLRAGLLDADERADITKLKVAVRKFATQA